MMGKATDSPNGTIEIIEGRAQWLDDDENFGLHTDSRWMENTQRIAGVTLHHCRFGDFRAVTPGGWVWFDRQVGQLIEGQNGRAHRTHGPGLEWLRGQMATRHVIACYADTLCTGPVRAADIEVARKWWGSLSPEQQAAKLTPDMTAKYRAYSWRG